MALAVTNALATDQRLHKVCLSLTAGGFAPTLLGVQWADSPPLAQRPYPTLRVALRARRGPAFYAEANWRLAKALLRLRPQLITANDLDTLPACTWAARRLRVPLLYDAHEFFTEMNELAPRRLVRAVWRLIESALYPPLRHVMTVHAAIAELYRQRYPGSAPAVVIPNLPLARPAPEPLPSPSSRILLYQGVVQRGRGLELALRALPHLPDCHLWVIGGGYHRDELAALASTLGVEGRVRWWGQLPFERLAELSPQASLGLALESAESQNLLHSAPNKLYDYLQARLPLVVAPRPVHSGLVSEYACGRILPSETPLALATAVRELLDDPASYQLAQAGAERAARALTWQHHEPELLGLYARALASSTSAKP